MASLGYKRSYMLAASRLDMYMPGSRSRAVNAN